MLAGIGSISNSPGAIIFQDHNLPVGVSATYNVRPSGDNAIPLGPFGGCIDERLNIFSLQLDPSILA